VNGSARHEPHSTGDPSPYSAKLVDRAVGITFFNTRAFNAVRHDPRATRQALFIVVLTSLGSLGPALRGTRPSAWQVVTPLLGVVCWITSAWLLIRIGTWLRRDSAPIDGSRQLLRLLGFVPVAALAGVILPTLTAPDGYAYAMYAISLLWGLLLVVKAIQHVLGLRTAPAIATVLLTELLVCALFLPIYVLFRSWGWA
jgi:hypothetical protein